LDAVLACVDVSYRPGDPGAQRGAPGGGTAVPESATAACLVWRAWGDPVEERAITARLENVAPYVPGAFYQRELPCLLEVLRRVEAPLEAVVIDGYVWLSADRRPGLGARLFEALGGGVAVVGVAKTSFQGAAFAEPVLRGGSARPLYVTAAGADPAAAAGWIRAMHGAHRIPTLLQRVDRLCRRGAAAG
jgi:deoxyribonuclease V